MASIGATFRILGNAMGQGVETRIGEGSTGFRVRRVQQLLARIADRGGCEFPWTSVDGVWGHSTSNHLSHTTKAFRQFQSFLSIKKEDRIDYVFPDHSAEDAHYLLFNLAKWADVLLPLSSSDGAAGLESIFQSALDNRVDYAFHNADPFRKEDRWVFGFPDRPYIIFTDIPPIPLPGTLREIWFDHRNRALNCVSFVNLAISIWMTGGAHAAPYDALLGSGGYKEIGSRYGMTFLQNRTGVRSTSDEYERSFGGSRGRPDFLPERVRLLGVAQQPGGTYDEWLYFYSSEEVRTRIVNPMGLYYVQWCTTPALPAFDWSSGFGHHDTLLYRDNIYESNKPQSGTTHPTMYKTSLGESFGKRSRHCVRMMGPL